MSFPACILISLFDCSGLIHKENGSVEQPVDETVGKFGLVVGSHNDERLTPEDYVRPLTEVVGIVRKGETPRAITGTRNWPEFGVYQSIDLEYICRFFRLFNFNAAKSAYIERVVDSYDSEPEDNYPVPATKDSYFKTSFAESHRKYLSASEALGLASGAGLLGLLRVLAK